MSKLKNLSQNINSHFDSCSTKVFRKALQWGKAVVKHVLKTLLTEKNCYSATRNSNVPSLLFYNTISATRKLLSRFSIV